MIKYTNYYIIAKAIGMQMENSLCIFNFIIIMSEIYQRKGMR